MRLKSVKLTNFRGYRNSTIIPIHRDMTGVVGRNDYGKSTILEALAIFFDSDGIKADRDDMNFFSLAEDENQFEIACEFDDLPEFLILDENVETTLAQEYLLTIDGTLEIVKTFKASTGKLDRTAIYCQHPTDKNLAKLLSLKITELRALGEQLGVTDNVVDKRVASKWREAIRAANQNSITLHEIYLDINKGLSSDSKSIWEKIQNQLPIFSLFKADRESSDGDAEAKNPLQQAVKETQATLQSEINALEQKIEESVLDVANRTLDKLREMAPELANELTPRFREKPKWSFNFTLDGENGIPINKRGSGVRRLILLNFFRAEAEKSVLGSHRNVIYAIEEPETSQHPNYQVMLMRALLELSNQPNRQIIITTHVPALAGLIPTNGIRYITKDYNNIPIVEMPNDDVLKMASESLGILPETGMERAKAIVLVEGKSDITFLHHIANTLKANGDLEYSLEDLGIVPILVGGCGSVKHWVTLQLANNLGLPWCVFLDSDNGTAQASDILKRKREVEAQGRPFYSTRKREIENYLCPDMIETQTGIKITFTDICDAKKIINSKTRVRADDVIDKYWPQMTASQILQRSMYTDEGFQRSELKELIENMLALVV